MSLSNHNIFNGLGDIFLDDNYEQEKNNKTFDNLLEELILLKEGTYLNNDTNISITSINDKGKHINIFNGELNYKIITSTNTSNYTVEVILDENATLYISKDEFYRTHKYIYHNENNHYYNIYNYGISRDSERILTINNNELIRKVDDTCYLGYNFEDNRIYVYYKKYNSIKNEFDFSTDYEKFKYNRKFLDAKDYYNIKLEKFLKEFKNSVDGTRFKPIADSIKIPTLNNNLNKEIEILKELVNIYTKYKNSFNILEEEKNIQTISDSIKAINREPLESKIKGLEDYINKIDLSDLDSLKKLQKEIDNILKSKNNNIIKRKKK